MNKHIFFTGFMASGKSRTGRALAERLNRPYVDTDAVIVERAGKTISEIFEQDGEAKFREMERDVVAEFAKKETPHIISLGGGLPVREKNRELLKKAGKVVYLRTSPETVYDRLKGDDTRPLLKSDDPLTRIKELQDERGKIYEEAADIIVDTDGKTPAEVADEIIATIGFAK